MEWSWGANKDKNTQNLAKRIKLVIIRISFQYFYFIFNSEIKSLLIMFHKLKKKSIKSRIQNI